MVDDKGAVVLVGCFLKPATKELYTGTNARLCLFPLCFFLSRAFRVSANSVSELSGPKVARNLAAFGS